MVVVCGQERAGLTEGQVEELVGVWQRYISCTHRILLQRQVLWQAMRASLLLTSLQDERPSAESKIQGFQQALELRRNMNDYHANFTLMMREWLLRILAPFQVSCTYPPPPPPLLLRFFISNISIQASRRGATKVNALKRLAWLPFMSLLPPSISNGDEQ